jgi:predicted aspartyl protease
MLFNILQTKHPIASAINLLLGLVVGIHKKEDKSCKDLQPIFSYAVRTAGNFSFIIFSNPKKNLNMRKLILACLFCTTTVYAQKSLDFRQGTIVQKNYCDTIPFEYIKTKIIIAVKVNGNKKRFLFDTGATLVVSSELQKEMNNEVLSRENLTDAVSNKKEVAVVKVKKIEIANLTFENIPAVVMDLKKADFVSCLQLDGILGSNALRNSIVQLDISNKIIILTDKIENINVANAEIASLSLDKQSGPHINIKLNDEVKIKTLFDSGSDELFSFSKSATEKVIKMKDAEKLNVGYGKMAIGIHGAALANEKWRVRFNHAYIGVAVIKNCINHVSEDSDNTIGMQLCEYGKVTIDYLNKKFYFQANKSIQEYKYPKTLGFTFQPNANNYTVGVIWSNSKAAEMGLKTGYQLLKVDKLDISIRNSETDCQIFFANLFKQNTITITYKNDKEEIKYLQLNAE